MKLHLDLGCGAAPRNPYNCQNLIGIDIRNIDISKKNMAIVAANLAFDPIPFPDNYFDSVSAYDFFEHIPRLTIDHGAKVMRVPFIELMNEIYRVLKPEGMLYAVTPAFPSEKAFRDPTHVNIITEKTVRYFTKPYLQAAMYGFRGIFAIDRHIWVHPRDVYYPRSRGVIRTLRDFSEKFTGARSHLLWELKAIKDNFSDKNSSK
jgi:SAM-dependent methyltransferase